MRYRRKIIFDLSRQLVRNRSTERTSNGADGTYCEKGCDRGKNGVRRKGVRKRNAGRRAPRAVANDTTKA